MKKPTAIAILAAAHIGIYVRVGRGICDDGRKSIVGDLHSSLVDRRPA